MIAPKTYLSEEQMKMYEDAVVETRAQGGALRRSELGPCTCAVPGGLVCRYHAAEAERPWDHRFPGNCPTFYDGCHCKTDVV